MSRKPAPKRPLSSSSASSSSAPKGATAPSSYLQLFSDDAVVLMINYDNSAVMIRAAFSTWSHKRRIAFLKRIGKPRFLAVRQLCGSEDALAFLEADPDSWDMVAQQSSVTIASAFHNIMTQYNEIRCKRPSDGKHQHVMAHLDQVMKNYTNQQAVKAVLDASNTNDVPLLAAMIRRIPSDVVYDDVIDGMTKPISATCVAALASALRESGYYIPRSAVLLILANHKYNLDARGVCSTCSTIVRNQCAVCDHARVRADLLVQMVRAGADYDIATSAYIFDSIDPLCKLHDKLITYMRETHAWVIRWRAAGK